MKIKLLQSMLAIMLFGVYSFVYAAERNSFSFKAGDFILDQKTQSIDASPITFDEESMDVFSFEYERLLPKNFSIAVGLTRYNNKIVSSSFVATTAESFHLMFVGRKYFELSKYFLPYLGVGIGPSLGTIDDTGISIIGFQGVAGIKIPLGAISLIVEHKVVSAKVNDIYSDDFDMSGKGTFAGIAFNF